MLRGEVIRIVAKEKVQKIISAKIFFNKLREMKWKKIGEGDGMSVHTIELAIPPDFVKYMYENNINK